MLTRTARYAEVPRGSFLGVSACVEQGVVCATNWTGCDTRSLCNNSAFNLAMVTLSIRKLLQ